MTNKEAIKGLKALSKEFSGYKPNEEMFDMAIKALELVTINSDSNEIKVTNCNYKDTIYRQAAIDAIDKRVQFLKDDPVFRRKLGDIDLYGIKPIIRALPSAQPERTCVNCGRTANNGGWYADGGTRCPIEEHYALPKDGFCHLWEKRNVTDDDYPERRTDESNMRDK